MRYSITKANMRRLSSLSALGAGALSVGVVPAVASSIIYSGILDERVGFTRGYGGSATFRGPNGVGGLLFDTTTSRGTSRSARNSVILKGHRGAYGTQFRFLGSRRNSRFGVNASGFRAGDQWDTVTGRILAEGFVIGINYTSDGGYFSFTAFNRPHRYLLFEFTGGKQAEPLYGWAQFDASLSNIGVTLVDWAYDTSGAQIPAGDTGQSGTPEPSTFVLTGLTALALGAKGLRAWRVGRASRLDRGHPRSFEISSR